MTPCRGIHKITCRRKSGCTRKLEDVQPECISCQDALTQILDLEGKVLFEYQVEVKKGTKGQRYKGTEAQSDKGTEAQRNKGTETQRNKRTKAQRQGIGT